MTTDTLRKAIGGARADLEAYFSGDASRVAIQTLRVPEDVDVKSIRESLAMSQRQFADMFGFSLSSVQSWERTKNRRKPTRATRILLTALRNRPDAVLEALVEREPA